MIGGALAWIKSNIALVFRGIGWCYQHLRRWQASRPKSQLRLSPVSGQDGVPFRDGWWFVAILLSNNRETAANNLSVTMEFRRARAVFNPIRVPFLRQDPSSGAYYTLDVVRLLPRDGILVPVTFYRRNHPRPNSYYLPDWPNPMETFDQHAKWTCKMRVAEGDGVATTQTFDVSISDWFASFSEQNRQLKGKG
jgi:hypothetical protein